MEKSQKRILYWKIISLVVRPMRLQSWIDGMKIIQFLPAQLTQQDFIYHPMVKLGGNFKQVGFFSAERKTRRYCHIKDASVRESPGSATQLARKNSSSLSEGHITEWVSRSLNYFPLR